MKGCTKHLFLTNHSPGNPLLCNEQWQSLWIGKLLKWWTQELKNLPFIKVRDRARNSLGKGIWDFFSGNGVGDSFSLEAGIWLLISLETRIWVLFSLGIGICDLFSLGIGICDLFSL